MTVLTEPGLHTNTFEKKRSALLDTAQGELGPRAVQNTYNDDFRQPHIDDELLHELTKVLHSVEADVRKQAAHIPNPEEIISRELVLHGLQGELREQLDKEAAEIVRTLCIFDDALVKTRIRIQIYKQKIRKLQWEQQPYTEMYGEMSQSTHIQQSGESPTNKLVRQLEAIKTDLETKYQDLLQQKESVLLRQEQNHDDAFQAFQRRPYEVEDPDLV